MDRLVSTNISYRPATDAAAQRKARTTGLNRGDDTTAGEHGLTRPSFHNKGRGSATGSSFVASLHLGVLTLDTQLMTFCSWAPHEPRLHQLREAAIATMNLATETFPPATTLS